MRTEDIRYSRLFEPAYTLYLPVTRGLPSEVVTTPPCILCRRSVPPQRIGWVKTGEGGGAFSLFAKLATRHTKNMAPWPGPHPIAWNLSDALSPGSPRARGPLRNSAQLLFGKSIGMPSSVPTAAQLLGVARHAGQLRPSATYIN
jgi:hypothetical protein